MVGLNTRIYYSGHICTRVVKAIAYRDCHDGPSENRLYLSIKVDGNLNVILIELGNDASFSFVSMLVS